MSAVIRSGIFGRSRWIALGASIAVVVGAGGVLTSSAGSANACSSLVPISPCRLLDTRPGSDNVGARATPVGPGETFRTMAWGTNGNCSIPAGATGLSMNVTAILPTASSFLTVFGAEPWPLAASLNWVAGQAPTPNAVTSPLTADGQIGFYNLSGTVHLAVDVVGFYEPSSSGPAGPPRPCRHERHQRHQRDEWFERSDRRDRRDRSDGTGRSGQSNQQRADRSVAVEPGPGPSRHHRAAGRRLRSDRTGIRRDQHLGRELLHVERHTDQPSIPEPPRTSRFRQVR